MSYRPPESTATSDASKWIKELRERFVRNSLGASFDLPNVIFLASEVRTLHQIQEKEEEYSVIPEIERFNWLARYNATERREGSIQNYLFTLKAVNEEKYERIVSAVNEFLWDKKNTGFDKTTAELMISTSSGQKHPAHLLSSGEKQILLIIAFIARELRPGGIVLVDEPDLHLHVSLRKAFISYLKRMVAEQHGQLILASHAPELWEQFTQSQRVELGRLEEIKA